VADREIRGHRFHVQRLGTGSPVVVFVHGLVMDNLSSWYFTVANPVARFASVLLYDLRGHGRSERPETGYQVTDMVADLKGMLDVEEIDEPIHLVGNSFGGLLALAFALEHPSRVAGLILVDAHWSEQGWADEMVRTLGLQGAERDQKILESFQDWLGRHSGRKRNRLAKNAEALVYGTSLLADLEASPTVDEARLMEVQCPVLALYGEHSDIRQRGERLAAALPQCTLRVVEGCTHSILWEATEKVRSTIVNWLKEQREGV